MLYTMRQLQAAAKKRVKAQVSSFARRSLSVEARKRKHVAVENRSKEGPVLKRSNAQVDFTADDSNAPVDPGMARPADPGMARPAESSMPAEPSPVMQMAQQNRIVESSSSVSVARYSPGMLGPRDMALLRARAEGRSAP